MAVECYKSLCAFHEAQINSEIGPYCQLNFCVLEPHTEITQSEWPELHHSNDAKEGDIVWGIVQKIGGSIKSVRTWHLSRRKVA